LSTGDWPRRVTEVLKRNIHSPIAPPQRKHVMEKISRIVLARHLQMVTISLSVVR
jgi:hypothetical protein